MSSRLGKSGKAVSAATAIGSHSNANTNQKKVIRGRAGQRRRGPGTKKKM